MYQYKNHAPHNEYFVTHGPGYTRHSWMTDNASLGFVVKCEFKYPLSHQVKYYPADFPSDAYDPMLNVVRTFEFKRPRTGDLDSLVNLGLVHFKYSQCATPEERPKSVLDNTPCTTEYVNNVCAKMNQDMEISNIKQITLLEGGYFEFVCEGEDGQDKIVKDETKYKPDDTPSLGPFKYNGSWPFWNYHYKTQNAPRFESELQLNLTKVQMRSRYADAYHV